MAKKSNKRKNKRQFRRNKQLTGRESRLEQRKKSTRLRIGLAFVLVITILAIVYWITTTRVSTVKVNASDQGLATEVESLTRKYLASSDSRLFFFDKNDLKSFIADNNSDVKSVEASVSFVSNKLVVDVIKRSPALIMQSRGAQYFIDEDGYSYRHRTNESRNDLPLVIDRTALKLEENKKVLSEELITFITRAKQAINDMDKQVKEFQITGVPNNLTALTSQNIQIHFDTASNINNQINRLEETFNYIVEQKKNANEIDLRTERKAFIK